MPIEIVLSIVVAATGVAVSFGVVRSQLTEQARRMDELRVALADLERQKASKAELERLDREKATRESMQHFEARLERIDDRLERILTLLETAALER